MAVWLRGNHPDFALFRITFWYIVPANVNERSKTDYFLNWKLDTKWEFGTLFSSLTVLNDRQRSSDQQVVHHFFPDFQILSDFQIRWRWVFKKTWFFPTWTTELDDRQRSPGTMYRKTVGAKAKTLVPMSLPTQTLIASQPSQIFAWGLKHRKVDDYGFIAIILRLSRCTSN